MADECSIFSFLASRESREKKKMQFKQSSFYRTLCLNYIINFKYFNYF